MKIFVHQRQIKCNFCLEWFNACSQLKCALNICQPCIERALNTSCFKFPSSDGCLYQVHLTKKNLSIQAQQSENMRLMQDILQQIDCYQQQQIKNVIKKWTQVSEKIKNAQIITTNSLQKVRNIFERNKEKFNEQKHAIIKSLSYQLYQVQTPQPLKDISFKKLQQSNQKKVQIKISDFILSDFQQSQLNSKKKKSKTIFLNQNQNSSTIKRSIRLSGSQTDRSMVSSSGKGTLTRIDSARKMELSLKAQKQQFSQKINAIKSNINSHLQTQNMASNIQRTMKEVICEAVLNTNSLNKCIQLVSHSVEGIDIECYLKLLKWENVEVVKLVKVGLKDEQGKKLLQFLSDKNIETLVVTNNNLTEQFCRYLAQVEINSLKNVYLGKNQIFGQKHKHDLRAVKQKYKVYI